MKACPICGAKSPTLEIRKERNGDTEIECRNCGFRDVYDISPYNYIMEREKKCLR